MPTLEASGTQSATVTTEHTLATLTGNKVYVLVVDTINMVGGDSLELRVKTKVLSGGTTRVMQKATYKHAQPADNIIKMSVPVPSDQEFVATLKQVTGTSRNYPWKVLSI